MLTRKTIKIIVISKVALVTLLVIALKGGFYIGDRTSIAQDQTDAKESSSPSANVEEDDEEYEYSDTGQRRRKRKSFLDKLLKIPKLEPGEIRKEEIGRYLTIVEKKKQLVDTRIDLLKQRETNLIKIERSVDEKLKLLEEERRFFLDTIQQERNLKNERTKQLVNYYKKMPAKKAAPVFEKLNKDLVVELFNQLPEKQIMNILSIMNPDRSVELTEYYGRLRSGREYDILKEMNSSLRAEFDECKGMPKKQATAANPQENAAL